MSKLKNNSAAGKRFKINKNGLVKAKGSGKKHGMIKRTNKFVRNSRKTKILCEADAIIVKKFLPM